MKVVVLGLRGFPNVMGGVESHCEHLYTRLVELGCKVTIIGRTPYIGKKKYSYKNVEILPFWSPKHKVLEALWHTFAGSFVAKALKPDIIHYHATGPSFFVIVGKMLRANVVATHHGFDYERAKWGFFGKKFIKQGERNLCKANEVIVISKHIQDSVKERLKRETTLIPNGVEIPDIQKLNSMKNKHDIKKGKYFLFTGRIVPEKCIHDLFDAYEKLDTDWKLVIAGNTDHEDQYSKMIKKRGSGNPNIVMTGFVKGQDLAELYSNAGCFVLPSSHEGLPIALLEALSYGLPCVASDIAANKSVGHHSIKYFNLHDVDMLSKSMSEEINDAKKIDHDEIRKFIKENYNWDDIAEKTLEVYKKIIK